MLEKISVIMANYNKEKYIEEAIQSILNQDYCNIELIIIDDGSTDSSPEIIKRYASIDSRIKYELLPHLGKVHAFNRGVTMASGSFLTIRSSDDVMFKNALSILRKAIDGYDLVGHNLTVTDERLNVIKTNFIMMSRYLNIIKLADVINGLSFPSGSYLLSLKTVDRIFPIPEKVPFEDWYIFMLIVNKQMAVNYLDEDLAYYRQIDGSSYGGVFNTKDEIIKYRAKRELLMLDHFMDMLPKDHHSCVYNAKQDLYFILEGNYLKALICSRFSLKRRPFRLLAKKVVYPFIKRIRI